MDYMTFILRLVCVFVPGHGMCFLSLPENKTGLFRTVRQPVLRHTEKSLFFYRSAVFAMNENDYPKAPNFLGFMSIICTILKKNMFSDKKYI